MSCSIYNLRILFWNKIESYERPAPGSYKCTHTNGRLKMGILFLFSKFNLFLINSDDNLFVQVGYNNLFTQVSFWPNEGQY